MDVDEEMVKLLLSGSRMLSYHCPRCALPLFKREGRVVCVRCGEVRVVESSEGGLEGSAPAASERELSVLRVKRDSLLKRLESEEDPKRIVSLLDAISRIDEMLFSFQKKS